MTNHSRQNADSTTTIITEFAAPGAIDWIAISGMLSLYGSGLAAPYITPGSKIWDLLLEHAPFSPNRLVWVARTVVPLLALVHAFEAVLFDQLRMRRHGVRRWSALWWKWEFSCFVEGVGAWVRIGKVIAEKENYVKRR